MLDSETDRENMAQIYEAHRAELLIRATKITINKEMAEDAVHNAFLSIIKHKDKLFRLSKRELRAQLIIIVKNKCIDLLRQRDYFSDESIDDMKHTVESDDLPVEDKIISAESYEAIREHMAKLDEQNLLVLEMKYIRGLTYKEIGEEMGITAKHVDTKIMRAKNKVRKLLEKEVVFDDK